jgi:glycosyltransferase involved in cell wall biosynthesis
MIYPQKVFILILTGREPDAIAFARRRYPSCEMVILSKAQLRESNWKAQLRKLRQLRGEAFLIFTDSLKSIREPMLMKWTVLLHGCRETVLADSGGECEVSSKRGLFALLPQTLFAGVADLLVFAFTWLALKSFQGWLRMGGEPDLRPGQIDLAYLLLTPIGVNAPGGALTHVTGFLSGLVQERARTALISGQPLRTGSNVHVVPESHLLHLFREAGALAYNIRFIAAARRFLKGQKPRFLYQRHGRFLFAGAVLSRLLHIPLVLEYNGSEVWIAKHWDPARFAPWLRLCEELSIKAASSITVVSNPLKQELMQAGVAAERIIVNPNAVDPAQFVPNCGGVKVRANLRLGPQDVVVGFVGTFSYWHGIAVLEKVIQSLLDNPQPAGPTLKFLLVGDGLLAPQMRNSLEPYVRQGSVIFTGTLPHYSVRTYLDAADILVSPHVPMPDGRPFFGSPTKLFEYMAMGKAIVASALDQIAEVLEDGKTALLVKPGDSAELALAIERLAMDAQLRAQLGRKARETALARHTWRQNARRVLESYKGPARTSFPAMKNALAQRGTTVTGTSLSAPPVAETVSHSNGSGGART